MPSSRQKFKLRHQPHSFSIPPPQASCLPHPSSCSILGLAPESPRIGPNRHQCSQGVCGESPPACSGLEHSVARPATRPPKFTPPKWLRGSHHFVSLITAFCTYICIAPSSSLDPPPWPLQPPRTSDPPINLSFHPPSGPCLWRSLSDCSRHLNNHIPHAACGLHTLVGTVCIWWASWRRRSDSAECGRESVLVLLPLKAMPRRLMEQTDWETLAFFNDSWMDPRPEKISGRGPLGWGGESGVQTSLCEFRLHI